MPLDRLILVQHAQSRHHLDRRVSYHSDSENGLTDLGRQQAAAIAPRLRRELPPASCSIYSSDMQRAKETAQIIGDALQVVPQLVPELREWNGHLAMTAQ